MSLQTDIQSLVAKFASDLEALVRSAAVEAVQSVLGGSSSGGASAPRAAAPKALAAKAKGKPGRRPKAHAAAPKAPAAAKAAPKAKGKGKRIRRTAEQIAATANQIHAHVRSNPSSNAEGIKKALGIPDNQWGNPLGLLISSKRLVSKGEKRATTYTAR